MEKRMIGRGLKNEQHKKMLKIMYMMCVLGYKYQHNLYDSFFLYVEFFFVDDVLFQGCVMRVDGVLSFFGI